MLNLTSIKKDYIDGKDVVSALKGIDLSFRKNEFVSILGPSGCGKTTLLNIIGGLDKYSDGDLTINGVSTKDYEDKDWDAYRNHSIGFVFQNYNLIPHLTALENVELALTLSGISKEERKKKAIESLEKVGLMDKINKRPNQLSGGEMQRVAIARAIINNPDIILADEPTGALDSKTSIQIMEILKEVSKEKLIIMVTHNPEIAKQYSNRVITLLDGCVTSDSNPYDNKIMDKNIKEEKKTSMSFVTALFLSFKNLMTKKTRTILTAVAGSIGIIGVALVLALSNGFSKYMDKLQTDTLSIYPLTIEEKALDINDIMDAVTNIDTKLDKYPGLKEVYVNEVMSLYESLYSENNITQEYIDNVIENIDRELINDITYGRKVEMNLFTNQGIMKQTSNGKNMYIKLTTKLIWQQMLNNTEFIKSQYDVLEGRIPNKYDEVVIVLDEYNQLTDAALTSLGLYKEGQEKKEYSFDELMGIELKLLTNDEMYYYNDGTYKLNGVNVSKRAMITQEAYDSGVNLKVVGILRPNKSTTQGILYSGIAYLPAMIDYIIERNQDSQLATYMRENEFIDPFTGNEYIVSDTEETVESLYYSALKKYGVDSTPTEIKIYAKDFNSKVKIKEYLNECNEGKAKSDAVVYTDLMGIIVQVVGKLANAVSYVLIAFSSISLIVSSIMIAITTYISVVERTKEIGVLRSIGARKKDISRVFNSETFIIGLAAGIFGVLVTLILTIPINLICASLISGVEEIASLSLKHAITLILISVILTLISGFIPSRIAAKKKPVEALRSE